MPRTCSRRGGRWGRQTSRTGSLAWGQGGAWAAATTGEWWGSLAVADKALWLLGVVNVCATRASAKASPYCVLAVTAARPPGKENPVAATAPPPILQAQRHQPLAQLLQVLPPEFHCIRRDALPQEDLGLGNLRHDLLPGQALGGSLQLGVAPRIGSRREGPGGVAGREGGGVGHGQHHGRVEPKGQDAGALPFCAKK